MDRLTKQQQQAHAFIVEQGKSQKETAALVGVSEKSIGTWVKRFGWRAEQEENMNKTAPEVLLTASNLPAIQNSMACKKAQAKQLLEVFGYNQKQTAATLKISEKSIAKWARMGKWKVINKCKVNAKQTENIAGFFEFLKTTNKPVHKKVEALYQRYKDSLHS